MNNSQKNYYKTVLRRFDKVDRVFALTCVYHLSQEEAESIAREMADEDG
jgi:hypothetical protein